MRIPWTDFAFNFNNCAHVYRQWKRVIKWKVILQEEPFLNEIASISGLSNDSTFLPLLSIPRFATEPPEFGWNLARNAQLESLPRTMFGVILPWPDGFQLRLVCCTSFPNRSLLDSIRSDILSFRFIRILTIERYLKELPHKTGIEQFPQFDRPRNHWMDSFSLLLRSSV